MWSGHFKDQTDTCVGGPCDGRAAHAPKSTWRRCMRARHVPLRGWTISEVPPCLLVENGGLGFCGPYAFSVACFSTKGNSIALLTATRCALLHTAPLCGRRLVRAQMQEMESFLVQDATFTELDVPLNGRSRGGVYRGRGKQK